jgi:sugar lactone lactonase YvrE
MQPHGVAPFPSDATSSVGTSGDSDSADMASYLSGRGRTEELMGGLWYANGVTLAHDGQSVLVVETMGFRVLQYRPFQCIGAVLGSAV